MASKVDFNSTVYCIQYRMTAEKRVIRRMHGVQIEEIYYEGSGGNTRVVGYLVRGRSRSETAAFDELPGAEAHFAQLTQGW